MQLDSMFNKLWYMRQQLSIAGTIFYSTDDQDVDALALADDILYNLLYHGHSLVQKHQPLSLQALKDLADMEKMMAEFSGLQKKVVLADAILDSAHGQNVDALALANHILSEHILNLNSRPPSPQALRDLVDRVGPPLKYDDPYADCQ